MRRSRGLFIALLACVASCARAAAEQQPNLSKGGQIHVAAVQVTRVGNDLAANQANLDGLIREAAARGARYILLPEYYPGQMVNNAASSLESLRAAAEPLDGPIARHILALCKELDVYIGFPLAERRADGKIYNSTVYAGPDGIEGVYSKQALVRSRTPGSGAGGRGPDRDNRGRIFEAEIFAPGTSDGVITWGGVRIGALICADGFAPGGPGGAKVYRTRLAKGVQMFTHTSGSTGAKGGPHNPLPDAVARAYRRPVVFANHWVDQWMFVGNTQICDAQGNILAHVGPKPNVVIDALVELPPVEPLAGSVPDDSRAWERK